MRPLVIRAQWGLGDSIFARPFVRAATEVYDVYLETPWPELFSDLPVRFVLRERKLRTQMKNVRRQPSDLWVVPPEGAHMVDIGYNGETLKTRSIVQTIEQKYRELDVHVRGDPVWDLPDTGPCPVRSQRPIAFVRPVTQRKEWKNAARNPMPGYVNWVADQLMATHHVVVVADISGREEWLEGTLPRHHLAMVQGQLDVKKLIALMRHADVLVGGVGFIVPASIALRRNAFVILGGHGGHNHPRLITDPRMDLSRIKFAMPERFCQCTNMEHQCDKRIRSLPQQWMHFVQKLALGSSKPAPVVA